MKYIEYLNSLIKSEILKPDHLVIYGQNIHGGPSLAGLTKDLVVKENSRIINFTNAENSLVGFGFGLMMAGAKAIFFMKQMDFLLLGIDQLVNTYNIIRSIKHQPAEGSFTIFATVVDSGYEGPQSSLNNFADFCSIARVPGFAVTNKSDADYLLPKHLVQPGFRIIGISQRLHKTELIDPGAPLKILNNGDIFRYSDGKDVTLVSFNFSFPQVFKLAESLVKNGLKPTHFNVNSALRTDWTPIRESILKTKKIVLVDDSKSSHISGTSLLATLTGEELKKKVVLRRELREDWLHPISDIFEIDEEKIIQELKS